MIVVSDASPLANLAAIGRLDLLRSLYTAVLIPPAVAAEIHEGEQRGFLPALLAKEDWIRTEEVHDLAQVEVLSARLDRGEAEAIVLARECRADLLLMDERAGREVAVKIGLAVVGLLGTLLAAKRAGFLPKVRPALEALRDCGFWVRPDLYQEVLRAAGE